MPILHLCLWNRWENPSQLFLWFQYNLIQKLNTDIQVLKPNISLWTKMQTFFTKYEGVGAWFLRNGPQRITGWKSTASHVPLEWLTIRPRVHISLEISRGRGHKHGQRQIHGPGWRTYRSFSYFSCNSMELEVLLTWKLTRKSISNHRLITCVLCAHVKDCF